jgi:radical SAM superfamily enzyme YgiQ (UPF0313 family)
MKKVSFVQPNFQQGPTEINAYFLPYSVGCLWAYASSINEISTNYTLGEIIWKRDDIDTLSSTLALSDVIAFSCYIWNKNYTYLLAQKIKLKNPNVKIVFGGPEPAVTDPGFFSKHPYVDFVVKKEGEVIFKELLLSLLTDSIPQAPGLLINVDNAVIDTGEGDRILNLDQLPSPYLTGFFDQIIKENPNVTWNATVETNRGCPYGCTFCESGSLYYNKVRQFPMDRVLRELDWVGKHCELLYISDLNFGMFIDRDRIIVDQIVNVSNLYKVTKYFYTSWAKNQRNEVLELIKTLTTGSDTLSPNGLTVSVQSTNPGVLEIIKRTNLKQHKIQEIFNLALANQIPVYTEVILGLPGDTLESFKQTVLSLIESNNHHGIEIIQCQVLENAEMNLVQREVYNIKTTPVYDYMSRRNDSDDPATVESINIVTETASMPKADMIEAQVWGSFMHLFHLFGFSTQVSRYLNKVHNVSYAEFYQHLYEYSNQDSYIQGRLNDVRQHYNSWMTHGYLENPLSDSVSQTGVNLITALTLLIHLDSKVEYTLQLVDDFVTKHYQIDSAVKTQLMSYQQHCIVWYNKLKQMPIKQDFDFDFYGFLDHNSDLIIPTTLTFDFPEDKDISTTTFYENIYFGRKRGFGRSNVVKQHTLG